MPPVILPPQPMHVFIKKRTIITLVNNIFDLFTKVNQKFSFSVLKLQLDLKPGFKNQKKNEIRVSKPLMSTAETESNK